MDTHHGLFDQQVISQAKNFLNQFNFERLEWADNELTVYSDSVGNEQPFGKQEFVLGSMTRLAFDQLEEMFQRAKFKKFSCRASVAKS